MGVHNGIMQYQWLQSVCKEPGTCVPDPGNPPQTFWAQLRQSIAALCLVQLKRDILISGLSQVSQAKYSNRPCVQEIREGNTACLHCLSLFGLSKMNLSWTTSSYSLPISCGAGRGEGISIFLLCASHYHDHELISALFLQIHSKFIFSTTAEPENYIYIGDEMHRFQRIGLVSQNEFI